jgi:hypothetical protein
MELGRRRIGAWVPACCWCRDFPAVFYRLFNFDFVPFNWVVSASRTDRLLPRMLWLPALRDCAVGLRDRVPKQLMWSSIAFASITAGSGTRYGVWVAGS